MSIVSRLPPVAFRLTPQNAVSMFLMRNAVTRGLVAAILASSLIAVVGCGPRLPATAPVHGRVTVNSQPVSEGMIVFYPSAGRAATGVIGPDGAFKLTTFKPDDGALLGSHRVTIDATKIVAGNTGPKSWEEELKMGGIPTPLEKIVWLVPTEYAERQTTTLTAEVAAGENEINFELAAHETSSAPNK